MQHPTDGFLLLNCLLPKFQYGYTEHDGKRAVSARELHQFLENKRQFADWIKQRIDQYGFVENQDYCSFHNFVKRETGATTCKEYALSLDMAKELSMVKNLL